MNSEYRDTPIGKIPKDWNDRKLIEVCKDITDGSHFSPKEDKNGEYRIATVANIKNNQIDIESCKKISKSDFEKLIKNGCKAIIGDVLFTKDGTVGLSFVFKQDIDVVLLSSIAIIKTKNESLDPNFCAYVLKSPIVFQKIMGSKRGTGLKRIILKDLKTIRIPIPPINEQKVIADILSTIDDAIQKSDELIIKTEKIKKSFLNKFFKDDIKSENLVNLDSIFDVKNGTTPSTKNKQYWDNPTINWITPMDLGKLDGKITIEESERKISQTALNEVNLTLMPKQSIVMSTRAPVGYVAVITQESTFNQGCKGLISKDIEKVDPYYYCYYLTYKKYILQNRAGQSTFKELSTKLLNQFEVPEISITKQNKTTEVLFTIDDRIALEKKRKEKLEITKKGLMNDLLSGKKRVKGVHD